MAHRKIGQILIADGELTPQQVSEILSAQAHAKSRRMPHKRFGELALEKRMVAPTQLRWALEAQKLEDTWLLRTAGRVMRWVVVVAMLVGSYLAYDWIMAKVDYIRPGNQAPAFRLENAQRPGNVRLADFKGRVVLLNFGSPSCIPCNEETSELTALQAAHQNKGFSVVGIMTYFDDVGPDGARAIAKQSAMRFPVLLGNKQIIKDYGGVTALPTTLLIDRKGKIVKRWKLPVTREEVEPEIEALLQPREK